MSERDRRRGIFAVWQPKYAEKGIATFPLSPEKRPLTKGYRKVGHKGSAELADKYGHTDTFGFMLGRRSGITILDIDTKDETVLHEAQKRHGQSNFIVQSGGGFHAYYKYGEEGRQVRPWGPNVPIDVLGDGVGIAAPSITHKGPYQIIHGTWDDLDNLPPLHNVLDQLRRERPVLDGQRGAALFRRLLREAKYCGDLDDLMDVARTLNMGYEPPMDDDRVIRTAQSAWKYETSGNNWVGRKARAFTDREEILGLSSFPPASMLLNLLRVSHPVPGDRFAVDQVKTGELLCWDRNTVRTSIKKLIEAGHLAGYT